MLNWRLRPAFCFAILPILPILLILLILCIPKKNPHYAGSSSEYVAVRAGSRQIKNQFIFEALVNQEPVGGNVAFPAFGIIAGKLVVSVLRL